MEIGWYVLGKSRFIVPNYIRYVLRAFRANQLNKVLTVHPDRLEEGLDKV